MLQRALFLGMFLLALTCTTTVSAQGLSQKLVGSWKGQKAETEKLLKEKNVDADEIERVVEEVSAVTLTINKDKTFSVSVPQGPEELSGKWQLKSEDMEKKQVVLTLLLEFGGQAEPMDFTFTLTDKEGYVQVKPQDQQPAIFKLVKEDESK